MSKFKSWFSTEGNFDCVKLGLFLVAALVVIGVSVFVWLVYLDDNPPAIINSAEIVPNIVEPGQEIVVMLDWCKHTTAHAEARVVWQNELLYFLPSADPLFYPPGCAITKVAATVPLGLHEGEYVVKVELLYNVNHFATRVTEFEMGPIMVMVPE